MPLTKANLAKDTKTLPPVTIGDGTLTVTYRRPTARMLDELTAAVKTIPDDPTLTDTVAAQLLGFLTDWDYFEDDAETKKVPITKEALAELPYDALKQIYSDILDAEKPSPNA